MELPPTPEDVEGVDPALEEEAIAFASRVNAAIQEALGTEETLIRSRVRANHLVVAHDGRQGIPVRVKGEIVYRLKVHYHCTWNDEQSFLAIERSEFIVVHDRVSEPILHYDYERNGRKIPVAHINIHTYHPAFQEALKDAKTGSRARKAKGQSSVIHLPTGGHRFRPSLEDVLEMLIVDFEVDCSKDWRVSLQEGRGDFKEMQLAAAVTDHPRKAAETLRRLGYEVTWPADMGDEPSWKPHKFNAY